MAVLSAAIALFVVTSAGVVYAVVVTRRLGEVDVRLHPSHLGGTTYLIVGSDSRVDVREDQRASVGVVEGGRADLVLLLRVPDDGGRPRLLSVPRDLLVLDENLTLRRLALTRLDGVQRTVDALCESLGVGADHLVELDLAGFTEVVDAVGGVDVVVDAPIRDTVLNFELAPGTHHLDGAGALLFVRSRSLERLEGDTWVPVPNQRAEHAQEVLRAVAHDASPSITDPIGAHRLLWSATDAVSVDSDTGIRDLWDLIRALRRLDDAEDVRLPAVEGDGSIPFARLQPGAADALARIGAGGPGCRRPALAEARLDAAS